MHPIHQLIRRHASLYRPFAAVRDAAERVRWNSVGRPLPPPGVVKRELLRLHAQRFGLRVLVETGTFLGDTTWALAPLFDQVHTIELDTALYNAAVNRFRVFRNVRVYHGDSGKVIESLLAKLSVPALFWLDGHYSGEGTARGAADSPLTIEIDRIFAHPVHGHVILVDDARFLTGEGGYPPLEHVRARVARERPELEVRVAADVLIIRPRGVLIT